MKHPIWKTIEIGTPANSGSALLKEMRIERHCIAENAEKVLEPKLNWGEYSPSDERFPVSRLNRKINLVKIPANKIGEYLNPGGPNYLLADIYKRGGFNYLLGDIFVKMVQKLDLILAPPETAVQYILQFADHSPREYLCFPFGRLLSCGDNMGIEAGMFTAVQKGTASVLGFFSDHLYYHEPIDKLFKEFKEYDVQFVFRVR